MLNKKMIAALSFTISSIGFAGTMGPVCVPGDVTVPCTMKQWDIGVQALYLKPTYRIDPGELFPLLPGAVDEVGTKWAMAFALEGSYHFSTGCFH